MDRLCVCCGSSSEAGGTYTEAAVGFGRLLAERGIGLVYGGATSGTMGAVADAVLDGGGEVTGVLPESLLEREQLHEGLTESLVVETKEKRKQIMADRADGFVALPGGLGTQEEIFDLLGQAKHGFHTKPCGFLNVEGYYDHMLSFLDHAETEGFLSPDQRALVLVERDPETLLDSYERYSSPVVEGE